MYPDYDAGKISLRDMLNTRVSTKKRVLEAKTMKRWTWATKTTKRMNLDY